MGFMGIKGDRPEGAADGQFCTRRKCRRLRCGVLAAVLAAGLCLSGCQGKNVETMAAFAEKEGTEGDCKNALVRSSFGFAKNSFEGPCSTIRPFSIRMTLLETFLAKLISWVTTIIVIPSFARERMTERTSPVSSGSRAEVGSSK